MEKKPNENANKLVTGFAEKKMTRKEAIKKTGLVAVSATTMMVLLSKKSEAHTGPGHDGFNPGGGGPRTSPGHP
jgi:hypothetical protein